jgi:hypothetical protein
MRKRSKLLAIICLVALALTASGPGLASGGQGGGGDQGSGHGYGKFKDVEEGNWAYRDITMMEVKGVFGGYGNGEFGPQDPVTCIQLVLLVVRITGGQEAAGAMPLDQVATILSGAWLDPADPLPSWAGVRETLAYAYQQGYLNCFLNMEQVLFQPNAPASRLEVVVTIIDALGLTAAAQALNGTTITAPDASTVPAWAVGYVVLALDMGLLKGDDKGNLNLGSGVTRAQMAALLKRTNDKCESDCDDNVIEGKLTAVATGDAPTITIETRAKEIEDYDDGEDEDGTAPTTPPPTTPPPPTPPPTTPPPAPGDVVTATYPVAADAKIFREGKPATLADLVVGDEIEIRLLDGAAVVIDACAPSIDDDDIEDELEVAGPVVSATYDTAGLLTAITIVVSEIDGQESDEQEGGTAPTTPPADPAVPPATPTGPVVGSEFTFPVAADAEIDGKKDALAAGDYVELDVVAGVVVAVDVERAEDDEDEDAAKIVFRATFVSTATGTITVTITEMDEEEGLPNAQVGDTVTLNLATDVQIRGGGKDLGITDLKADDKLVVRVTGDAVTSIIVTGGDEGGDD